MYKQNNRCCQLMSDFLEDKRVPIDYSPIVKEYYLILSHSPAVQRILFCPWCGTSLPASLRKLWFDILEKEYNISDPYDKKQSKLIPKEFKTDEWWKKRDL